MQDNVRDVYRAWTLVSKLLLELEEAILDLFFDVERQFSLGAEELALAILFLL